MNPSTIKRLTLFVLLVAVGGCINGDEKRLSKAQSGDTLYYHYARTTTCGIVERNIPSKRVLWLKHRNTVDGNYYERVMSYSEIDLTANGN